MDDLISRQAAIDALHMHLMYRMGTDSNKKRLDEWINNLPSAQPEIIRCKDCKWYELPSHRITENCVKWWKNNGVLLPIKPTDFCSYGERK